MAISEGENCSPKSSDPQPIRTREIENSQPQLFDIQPIEMQKHNPALSSIDIQLMKNQQTEMSSHHHHWQPLSTNLSKLNSAQINPSIDNFHLWHRWLGHTSFYTLQKLIFVAAGRQSGPCEACTLAKQTRVPCWRYEHKAIRPLWRIYSDMLDMQLLSIDGKMYFITFIDDFTQYCWIYFTSHKDAKTIYNIYI